jgi:hypothetical protein
MTELNRFKITIDSLPIENQHSKNHYVKECLETLIDELLNDTEDYAEKITMCYFEILEEIGWNLNDTKVILDTWYKLGSIVGIKDIEEKLNTFQSSVPKKIKIEQLENLKKDKIINNEIPSTPLFYDEMRRIVDESIDNVIRQLNQSNKIDEMLYVFDKDMDKFLNISTEDYSFGDSEDRETIGGLYMQIMDIIGMKYSRGLLSYKLGLI